jgi:hypothetical protein
MSTFFLYTHQGKLLEQADINRIAAKLVHFSWVKTSVYSDNNLQLVYTANKSDRMRIFKNQEKGLTFFLQGDIFESSRGIEKIDESIAGYTLESQIIKRYLESGISSCVGLNGMYNLLVWDEKIHTLEIAGDRLGMFQIFFATLDNGRFAITSDLITLKSIIGYTPKISKRGIFDLLYMGTAFENRTVLEGVERLLPNASYNISNGILKLLSEFRLPFSKERWGYVTPRLLDELEYYYLKAIKRQFEPKDKIAFFQSGGKDSRIFSHFLNQAGIVPNCITLGERHHGEVFLAQWICKILKFPWQRIPISQNFNARYAEDFLEIDSFSGRIFGPFFMEAVQRLCNKYEYITANFLNDGINGCGLAKGKFEKSMSAHEVLETYQARWRTSFFSDSDLEKLFPESGRDWLAEYKKEVHNLFCRLAEEPSQMLIAFYLRLNERFKIGGALRSINAATPIRLPCIDNDLIDFLFSLPPALLFERQLLDIFLEKRVGKLSAIPMDQNSSQYCALTPSLKNELRIKLWLIYNKNIKFPYLGFINPISTTTQFYVQAFSMRDRGFRQLKNRAAALVLCLEGILDVQTAKELLAKEPPKCIDHILLGNTTRSLITSILIAKSFNSSENQDD